MIQIRLFWARALPSASARRRLTSGWALGRKGERKARGGEVFQPCRAPSRRVAAAAQDVRVGVEPGVRQPGGGPGWPFPGAVPLGEGDLTVVGGVEPRLRRPWRGTRQSQSAQAIQRSAETTIITAEAKDSSSQPSAKSSRE